MASIEQRYISFVVLPVKYLDTDAQGAAGFFMEITVLVSSRYNLAGDLRSGPQVQFREWLRSVDQ